ncbi:MAG TPA: 4-alpha-glucanotransferase [candidate division Zixibacteria bacterium]|nr:4-alpha-glucanotransferase [candidate division Zixibacteria bacterium]
MRFPRSGGVLAHPTSFPSEFGIGDLGPDAYAFIDFLAKSRQSLWQILPLGPTGYGDSPYQSFSAFAGNPLLVSPLKLADEGLLPREAFAKPPSFSNHKVDFGQVIQYKSNLLLTAYRYFQTAAGRTVRDAFEQFKDENAGWLNDYALFMALKNHHRDVDGGVWSSWPVEIALREAKAMRWWEEKLKQSIDLHKFNQYVFYKQWLELKAYANDRGIRIVGDVPIFVAYDSTDVWSKPEMYFLDSLGIATQVAGVPPDYFSATGQRWGNPLYRWSVMREDGYKWWADRLEMSLTQVDIIRIDHFRGFEAYWEIPAEEPTAEVGQWVKGPGAEFFETVEEKLGQLPIIAEDLGVITPEVVALRTRFDFPGMKILQFAFGGERNSSFLPHNFGRNYVVYTGTHDNETTLGWYENASLEEQDHVRRYSARDGGDISWNMIRMAYASVADSAVVPLQDLMSLNNDARMNFPGKTGGWWTWRYTPDMLNDSIAHRLRELTELFGRVQIR